MQRHPATGHLIENESEWRDEKGNWLDTKREEIKDAKGVVTDVKFSPVKPTVTKEGK